MLNKALVIGYGSIGKRHTEVLREMGVFSSIVVLSSQKNLPYETITSMTEIPFLNPDYFVIASPTSMHYKQLRFLEDHFEGRKNSSYKLNLKKNNYLIK